MTLQNVFDHVSLCELCQSGEPCDAASEMNSYIRSHRYEIQEVEL